MVDTATLAVALGRTPGYVRLLVHQGVITPAGKRGNGRGRPALLFDLDVCLDLLDPDTPGTVAC